MHGTVFQKPQLQTAGDQQGFFPFLIMLTLAQQSP
jgi:hypothetical protein